MDEPSSIVHLLATGAGPYSLTMNRLLAVVRVVLGLWLVGNAGVGTLLPPPPLDGPGVQVMQTLWATPWVMVLAKLVELLCGLALVTNRFVPLALVVFTPVLVNIVGFQARYAPGALPIGVAMVVATASLAWERRASFGPLLRARSTVAAGAVALSSCATTPMSPPMPTHGVSKAGLFFREVGPKDAPTVLLLHGFPSSSFHYRRLLETLGDQLHLVAPDYPGFGHSRPVEGDASFDRLTDAVETFCLERGLGRFYLYVFDFGAPVGMRLAERHPEWIAGVISQNGNVFEAGLSELLRAQATLSPEALAEAHRHALEPDSIRWQYESGAAGPVSPDGWAMDVALLQSPGSRETMLALLRDYGANVARYPAWQAWLATNRPPTLVVWGANDPFFVPAGAHAFRTVLPNAEVTLLPTGHFALEEQLGPIAAQVLDFVRRSEGARR